eukprot:scaffold955_cov72-Skeletonema_marinoi.AAC.1
MASNTAKHNGLALSAAGGSSAASASAAASSAIHANIEKRNAQMEQRKRELLLEARKTRIEWIFEDNTATARDAKAEWDGTTNPLKDLQACNSDMLPNAPDIIRGLLSSKCDWVDCSDDSITTKIASNVKDVMEKEQLQWGSISKLPNSESTIETDIKAFKISETMMHQDLNLTPIPPPATYDQFLKILCEPSAADIVISIQNFCKTVKEAARVMISLQGETTTSDGKGSATGAAPSATNGNKSELKQNLSVQNHTLSLVKALRGFVNSTIRDMENHSAFDVFLSLRDNSGALDGTSDNDAKDRLVECLEKFLFTKCRKDIDLVLSWEVEPRDDEHYHTLRGSIKKEQNPLTELDDKNVDELVKDSEVEMHEKLKSLQFVTPRHLEIRCLSLNGKNDIDLSYPMQQLKSLSQESSPRQMLQTILLAFRGINVALNSAIGQHSTPPGADDVLPTLILTVLRANPPGLLTNILFIERFAAVSLLRGEAGYAYTNLCGAVQFLRDLNVDEHMADVSMGEGAVLSIDPAEFRAGLEKCRMKMKAEEEEKESAKATNDGLKTSTDAVVGNIQDSDESSPRFDMSIAASDVRHARRIGRTADLDWALQRQKEVMWKDGKVATNYNAEEVGSNGAANNVSFLPPEDPPLPSNFSRSYSYLATSPNDIRMSDLPKLLKEYRMLVYATESLLNERQTWRESERKRLMQMERETLEKNYEDVIGKSL